MQRSIHSEQSDRHDVGNRGNVFVTGHSVALQRSRPLASIRIVNDQRNKYVFLHGRRLAQRAHHVAAVSVWQLAATDLG